MMSKVGIAVVGCGYWGTKHVRIVHESPHLDLVLAVDARPDSLDYVTSNYAGVTVSRDFDDALKSDAQGIIIATPVYTHFDLARAALLAGKHVLVEKPLATSSAECRELIDIARRNNLILMVGHTFEYHPAISVTRNIVQQGLIGEVYYANSRRLNLGLYQTDVNVLWDLAPHDLSILFSVLDTRVVTVDSWGCRHVLPHVEDVAYAKMGLASGATALIHVSWLDPVKVRQFTIVGSEGMLIFDDIEPVEKVRIYDKCFKPIMREDSFVDFQAAYHTGDVHAPEIPSGEPLALEVADFADCIVTGKPPRTRGERGLRVVETLELIHENLQSTDRDYMNFTSRTSAVGHLGLQPQNEPAE